jgi:diadenosine tetraphosphate (Ap4A) HIT family hydrolase
MSADCVFCHLEESRQLFSNDLAIAITDGFPVSRGHTLIIPKRHIVSLFDATAEERMALWELVEQARQHLQSKYSPDGFNIGINDGTAAGQTVMHLHIHLIPRYTGDVEDPRGGVRWIMPDRAKYWKDSKG